MHPAPNFDKTQARTPAPAYRPVDHLRPGRPARSDDERAVRHAEIERRYKQPLKNCSEQRRIAILRRCDLETLCRASDVPEDGGLDWLDIAANHIAFIYRKADAKIAAILRWRARFTPMVEVGAATELAWRVIANPRMPNADELAHRLGLTMARRTELGITTIGATDCDKGERAALRKERAAARESARRLATGAVPHATSARRTKPWQARGMSRATYYRNRQNETGETNSCAAHTKCVVPDTKLSHDDVRDARCARHVAPEFRGFDGDVPDGFRTRMASLASTLRRAAIHPGCIGWASSAICTGENRR